MTLASQLEKLAVNYSPQVPSIKQQLLKEVEQDLSERTKHTKTMRLRTVKKKAARNPVGSNYDDMLLMWPYHDTYAQGLGHASKEEHKAVRNGVPLAHLPRNSLQAGGEGKFIKQLKTKQGRQSMEHSYISRLKTAASPHANGRGGASTTMEDYVRSRHNSKHLPPPLKGPSNKFSSLASRLEASHTLDYEKPLNRAEIFSQSTTLDSKALVKAGTMHGRRSPAAQ